MNENKKQNTAEELEEVVDNATELARELGLDPYPVRYWVIDQDEMNQLIAYNGFQSRYPHWRWGMAYDRQQKKSQYLGGKAFEIVNNDNPSHAFLQASNDFVDQKGVITHVAAHADFFKNNQWFSDEPDASSMLDRNAEKVEEILKDSDVKRSEVEKWIDNLLCIEDTIDQYSAYFDRRDEGKNEGDSVEERVSQLGLDEELENSIFDEEWIEENSKESEPDVLHRDLLQFFLDNGMQYDEDSNKAVEFEDWQKDIIKIIREEALYFAPQKMTKIMNEGWAAYWESVMMAEAGFATEDEFITFADHQSKVLGSPGLNPYKLGIELWKFIENKENRKEVLDKLLRVDGIKPSNFHKKVDFKEVIDTLDEPNSDILEEKYYSLTKPQNKGFLSDVSYDVLEEVYRYIIDRARYNSIQSALEDVDYSAGWNYMLRARESHNDITFLDTFLTNDFIDYGNYFTYEFSPNSSQMEVASTDPKDVKQKLLLQFSNFGKPTITVGDDNYKNQGILLLRHEYNGVMLDWEKARDTLERIFNLWGRPVFLKTIAKDPQTGEETGRMIKYDGSMESPSVEELRWTEVEDIAADDVDYDTKPDDWL